GILESLEIAQSPRFPADGRCPAAGPNLPGFWSDLRSRLPASELQKSGPPHRGAADATIAPWCECPWSLHLPSQWFDSTNLWRAPPCVFHLSRYLLDSV